MRYHEVNPLPRHHLEQVFQHGDPEEVPPALVGAAFHNSDWNWVQGWCLHFATSPYATLRMIAAICIGHIARIHGTLDLESCLPILEALRIGPGATVRAQAEDALEDIERSSVAAVTRWSAHGSRQFAIFTITAPVLGEPPRLNRCQRFLVPAADTSPWIRNRPEHLKSIPSAFGKTIGFNSTIPTTRAEPTA